jgi:predicted nucleic acid-binding Zn ribbon protein
MPHKTCVICNALIKADGYKPFFATITNAEKTWKEWFCSPECKMKWIEEQNAER